MSDLSRGERLDRLDAAIAQGRILRCEWTDEQDGREMACLLAALSPEAGKVKDASACPASVIPPWLAHLTPAINDCVSEGAWPGIIRRYASLIRRAAVLTEEDWRRLDYAARAVVLRVARVALQHAEPASTAIERVIALCDRAASGETVDREWADMAEAAAAAWSAAVDAAAVDAAAEAEAWTAALEAAADAMVAADAAVDAEWAAADAAWSAVDAEWAAADAEWAAAAEAWAEAAAVWAAARAARGADAAAAAYAAAWDTIANGILDAIDAACAAREASS